MSTSPSAVVFGLAGESLSADERAFFRDADPFGFILFARNCAHAAQVRQLVDDLRASVGRADAPILIDQEGGRVQRLRPPHWRSAPPAAVFGQLAERSEDAGLEAAWLNARLIAADLAELGITVDCAPVLDVRHPQGHDIIGDRAFSERAETVALLGSVWCSGLLAGGVLPIIKHIPGHGRAGQDSHLALPVVDAAESELQGIDFAPFAALQRMPMAMTAHVVYVAIDADAPATTSRAVVERVIRGTIGFEGLLISDDLTMRALTGSVAERTKAALAAGCDVVLHCSGEMREMREIMEVCPQLAGRAQARVAHALSLLRPPEPFDAAAARERLAVLLADPAFA